MGQIWPVVCFHKVLLEHRHIQYLVVYILPVAAFVLLQQS